METIRTYRFRIKNPKDLPVKAIAVNQVWNYCGDVQNQARRRRVRWPSHFDLNRLTAGSSKDLQLRSSTISEITKHFTISRDRHRKRPRWRKSHGSRRSLGWVPFAGRAIKTSSRGVTYLKKYYPAWIDRPIPDRILCGSFSEDARGRWFVNLTCEVGIPRSEGVEVIGIDLGLKDLAALSTGEKIPAPQHYRREEERLGIAQRAGRKQRVAAIHAKIRNRRRHELHVISSRLVRRARAIFIGDVSAAGLSQTRLAKSVHDVGWSTLRTMLQYKGDGAGITVRIVDEAYSTQICSACHARCGPRGLKDLGVRSWMCSGCGMSHDRDVNAARNILRSGSSADLRRTGSPEIARSSGEHYGIVAL